MFADTAQLTLLFRMMWVFTVSSTPRLVISPMLTIASLYPVSVDSVLRINRLEFTMSKYSAVMLSRLLNNPRSSPTFACRWFSHVISGVTRSPVELKDTCPEEYDGLYKL